MDEWQIAPVAGDIIAVRSVGFAGRMIRLGSALIDEPNLANHIAVLHHQDAKGTWWALEGRPGGVGWRDATAYLSAHYTISNVHQAKTDAQRNIVCAVMARMISTKYDWEAIVEDGERDLHIPDPWGEKWNGEVAGHVVCSSVAVVAYHEASLGYPENIDQAHVQPADWVKFIMDHNYE